MPDQELPSPRRLYRSSSLPLVWYCLRLARSRLSLRFSRRARARSRRLDLPARRAARAEVWGGSRPTGWTLRGAATAVPARGLRSGALGVDGGASSSAGAVRGRKAFCSEPSTVSGTLVGRSAATLPCVIFSGILLLVFACPIWEVAVAVSFLADLDLPSPLLLCPVTAADSWLRDLYAFSETWTVTDTLPGFVIVSASPGGFAGLLAAAPALRAWRKDISFVCPERNRTLCGVPCGSYVALRKSSSEDIELNPLGNMAWAVGSR